MKEFETLILAGRGLKTGHGFRGALIQLEGKVAYLTNLRRSILFKVTFQTEVGTGTFYSSEAPLTANRIERRDDRVLFEYKINGVDKTIFIPNKPSIQETGEEILSKHFTNPKTDVPMTFLDNLDPSFPITKLQLRDDSVVISQKRGDGSVEIQSKIPMKSGFDQMFGESKVATDNSTENSVNLFTRDLTDLKTTMTGKIKLNIEHDKPLSLRASMGNAEIIGVIGNLTYDEE